MQHLARYLALTIIGTSLLHAPIVWATEARNLSPVLNDLSAHKIFGRATAYGVALGFECPGFKK